MVWAGGCRLRTVFFMVELTMFFFFFSRSLAGSLTHSAIFSLSPSCSFFRSFSLSCTPAICCLRFSQCQSVSSVDVICKALRQGTLQYYVARATGPAAVHTHTHTRSWRCLSVCLSVGRGGGRAALGHRSMLISILNIPDIVLCLADRSCVIPSRLLTHTHTHTRTHTPTHPHTHSHTHIAV